MTVGEAVEWGAVGDKVIGDYSYVSAQFVETPYRQCMATNHRSTESMMPDRFGKVVCRYN